MTRDEFDALGNKHKKFEQLNKQHLMPYLPIMVRVDGRAFHTFTKGLKRPYDFRLSMCMQDTAKTLLEEFNGHISYTQSDEISMILKGDSDKQMFGGSVDKINSIISSTASVAFYKALLKYLPEKAENTIPVFDCRAFQYPTLGLYAENLMWREADATRNSLTMACHAHFDQKKLHKVNRMQQHELLNSIGINWNDFPSFFKRGVYFSKRDREEHMSDDIWNKIPKNKKPSSRTYLRSVVVDLELPPVFKIANLTEVIFSKSPVVMY